jgi:hypothetical protein
VLLKVFVAAPVMYVVVILVQEIWRGGAGGGASTARDMVHALTVTCDMTMTMVPCIL